MTGTGRDVPPARGERPGAGSPTSASGSHVPDAAPSPLASTLIDHVEFARALGSVLESIADPSGVPLVLCLGVAGFGKTRLAETIERHVTASHLPAMQADPNLVPVVRIEAYAPDAGRSFGWREGFLQILAALNEHGVELRAGDALDPDAHLARHGASRRTRSERQLQLDVIDALRFHGTRVLLIDEIEHIAYQKDVARFAASADTLKTIANETGVRIVATGSYEGLGFRNVSGQILRRRRFVHLRRYRADVPAEYAEYARVVAEALEVVGHDGDPALVEVLYRQSLGTIGTTVDFLMQAVHAARWHGEPLLHGIARTARSDADLAEVAAATVAAERSLAPDPEARTRLYSLLGLAPVPGSSAARHRAASGPPRATRPGRRKPSRDLVGVSRAG